MIARNPKLLHANKVAKIERYDVRTPGLHGDLEDHIVLRIAQKRSPQEEDLAMMRDAAHKVEDGVDLVMGQPQLARLTPRYGFVFQYQRHRHAHLEVTGREALQQRERAPRRDRNPAITRSCRG